MANPAPCQACDKVPDADYFLTNRLDTPWPYEQSTVALCFHCLIDTANMMAEAYSNAMKALEEMEQPGVLEQIEEAEGQVRPAPSDSKRKVRKESAPEPVPVRVEAAEETAAANDLG